MPYGIPPYGLDQYGNDLVPTLGDVVYVYLPGVYIDDLEFDDTEGLFLENRVPAAGSEDNAKDTNIYFQIFDTSGSTVDVSTLNVTVEGVDAIIGGVFQTGFDGPDSAIIDGGNVVTVTIDPTTDFESEQVVDVVVQVTNIATTYTLNEPYAFTIEDFTPPMVLEAYATGEKTIVVVFNESMKMTGDGSHADALTPGNYIIVAKTAPAVPLEVLSVAALSDTMVELTVDIEMTPGAVYNVTVSGAEDVSDNEILPPDDNADFAGYACPKPARRRFDLWDWIPPEWRRADATVGDLALWVACFQDVVDLLLCNIDRFSEIYDIDKAPEPFVDAILADLGNPFPFALSLIDKRRLARLLVAIYKQKGTAQGIINVIRFFLGIEVEVVPLNIQEPAWILGESELGIDTYLGTDDLYLIYSFKILSPVNLTADQIDKITHIANYMKPAHTHLYSIEQP